MKTTYDVAVLGLGTMGSLTCMQLARRKVSVLGIDRFAPPHGFGSHSGDTRVFRTAYAEHPSYVPLAQAAGYLWDEYGAESGMRLLTRCGQLSAGRPDDDLIKGILRSAELHSIPLETLDGREIQRRYPAIAVPAGHIGVFEATAGWIDVNAAIRFGIEGARRHGADILLNRVAYGWERRGDDVVIQCAEEEFSARRLVITAGPWAQSLLRQLPLTVQRRVLVWIRPLSPEAFAPARMPVFTFAEKFFYGFPALGDRGVKIAVHWHAGAVLDDPGTVSPPNAADLELPLQLAARYLPSLAGPLPAAVDRVIDAKTCLYSMTPDEHFLIGPHPECGNVFLAAGFSGHGFKFAPAIATAMTDLALEGHTDLPLDLFAPSRFRNELAEGTG